MVAQLDRKIDLKSLPKAQARVEIAKDVIAAVKAGRIKPTNSVNYVAGTLNDATPGREVALREAIPQLAECEVCAIGAIFMAHVARDNEFTVRTDNEYVFDVDSTDAIDHLGLYFSEPQLRLMEGAYEGYYIGDKRISNKTRSRCRDIYDAHGLDSAGRLIAIMRNVIRNNGTFKP